MIQYLCLILAANAAFALKKSINTDNDAKYELLRAFVEKATDGNLAKSLIDIILNQENTIKAMEKKMNTILDQGTTINDMEMKMNTILDQGNTINAMEKKMNTILDQGTTINDMEKKMNTILDQGTTINDMKKKMNTILDQGTTINDMEKKMNTIIETVHQQGKQIRAMQGRITDMETIIKKQNKVITNLEHEKEVFHDTIMGQREDMDSMEKDITKIIETVQKDKDGHLMNDSKVQEGRADKNTIWRTSIIPNDVLTGGIRKKSKSKNNAAAIETDDRVLADKEDEYNKSNNKNVNVFHDKNGHGFNTVQKRAVNNVSHVAFSTYLTHEMAHLSVGHVIKLDQIFINDGNGYNKNTGIFSVPKSGVYLLTYSIDNTHGTHHLEVELVVDNRNMGTLLAYNYAMVTSKTIITHLSAGQSVWLETYAYNDANVYGASYNKFTTFSGVLLY